ncbi:actin-like ATPase domain-containing protein [Trichoderma cornu-damae]|uniref:Actin-like ATPase domain-containing protein n=1 Tax=Trichoderma cornu-damae TaxID=654480 RepID=A0A9P8QN98_9HYPO|nr:actin-like ATPase domain-containing protein [Trichoderma cornu-damae]
MSKMMTITERTKLIVGIDYGTTYSGLSFALSNAADFKDIFPWTKYPGSSSHGAEHFVKAPTRVAFRDENPELDENAWGYQVEPGMKTHAWTKLLLDKSSLMSEYDDPDLYLSSGVEIMQLPKGRSAKDVAAEYLRGMKRMFDDAVREHLGSHKIENLPIEFWLTVPASWSEKAKLLTKHAAMDAGFATRSIDKIMLISEPEAAAQLALKSSLHRLEDFVKPQTGVMVCDCGGGTVDITTYEVEETNPVLKLREIAVGVAGKCGGTFVDRNLFRLLADRFGVAFTSLGPEQIGPGSAFMDQFELKKKDFSMKTPSRRAHRLVLHMPDLKVTPAMEKYYERRSSSVLLTQADYKMLFDQTIEMVIKLVEEQVNQIKEKKERPIETIVLVGGFGSSPYLKERLTEWCQTRGIRLTTPISGAWSAVVCGAVLRGLEGSIVRQKKCRRHYGHTISNVYKPFIHTNFDKEKRKVWMDHVHNVEYLSGFMLWEVGKGDLINHETEINSNFFTNFCYRIPLTSALTLYSCNLDAGPETIENERVEEVGEVKFTLGEVDPSSVPQITKGGVTHFKLPLTLNIRLDDESGHLAFRILYKGREVGKAAINISDY